MLQAGQTLTIHNLACIQQRLWQGHSEWYNIGLELGLTADTLDSINKSNQGSVDECFRVTLKKWLQTVEPQQRSWRKLAEALRSSPVGLNDLANQLP